MFKKLILAAGITFLVANTSFAEDRQAVYQEALLQSEKLVEVLATGKQGTALRDQSVILAESIKQLAFSEAESREDEKIALPLGFNNPTSAASSDILIKPAGEKVSISKVPMDWFTGYLEKAENEIHMMLKEMDAGDTTSIDKYLAKAQEAHRYLELMVMPPNS